MGLAPETSLSQLSSRESAFPLAFLAAWPSARAGLAACERGGERAR